MSNCRCNGGPLFICALGACASRSLQLVRVAWVLWLAFASTAALAEEVRISGTGGLLAVVHKLGEGYRAVDPKIAIRVIPSLGSAGAIKALQAGALEIGVIARPLKDEEKASGLQSVEFARSPFVFVTHPSTGVDNISIREVAACLADPQKSWPDGAPVRPVLRPESDSDTAMLRTISAEMNDAVTATRARKGLVTAATDQDSADTIERVPGSLGAITLALLVAEQRKVKVLALDGVKPSLATLNQGSYPLSKTFYLVTVARPSSATLALIDYMKSPASAKVMSQYETQVVGTAAAR